jgi:hypothetical protein
MMAKLPANRLRKISLARWPMTHQSSTGRVAADGSGVDRHSKERSVNAESRCGTGNTADAGSAATSTMTSAENSLPQMIRPAQTLALRAIVLVLVLTAFAAACGSDDSTVAPTATTTTPTTEVYSGTLAAGGAGFYSFNVSTAGTVTVTFASLTDANGRPFLTPLTIGLGVPAGEGCSVTSSVTAPPGLSAQLSSMAALSTYCVQLSDAGALTAPANFGVRIVHP